MCHVFLLILIFYVLGLANYAWRAEPYGWVGHSGPCPNGPDVPVPSSQHGPWNGPCHAETGWPDPFDISTNIGLGSSLSLCFYSQAEPRYASPWHPQVLYYYHDIIGNAKLFLVSRYSQNI